MFKPPLCVQAIEIIIHFTATYDASGQVDYLDTFDESGDQYNDFAIAAGARIQENLVDLSSRSGYSLTGSKPETKQAQACEYYQLDWESGKYSDTELE